MWVSPLVHDAIHIVNLIYFVRILEISQVVVDPETLWHLAFFLQNLNVHIFVLQWLVKLRYVHGTYQQKYITVCYASLVSAYIATRFGSYDFC